MQKFSLPPTMVGALTQSYIKNGGSKSRLRKTLEGHTYLVSLQPRNLIQGKLQLKNTDQHAQL